MPKTILLVDDEIDIAAFLEKYLKAKKFNVIVINNPEEAEKRIVDVMPDMIFMDYRMSPITGKDILVRIRHMNLDIPVVMMSAYKTIDGYFDMRRLGAVEYIAKPFDFEEIDKLINQYLSPSTS